MTPRMRSGLAIPAASALAALALMTGCTRAPAADANVPMTDEGSIASASSASAAASAAAASKADAAASAAGSAAAQGSARATSPASVSPVATGPATVDVLITYAGFQKSTSTVEVGGVADGIVESDGQCTLTLSHAGQADVQLVHAATPDVRSTACGGFSVPKARMASGSWTAHLAYRSSRSAGTAAPVGFDVP